MPPPIAPPRQGAADAPGRIPPGAWQPAHGLWTVAAVALAILSVVILGGAIDRGHQFAFDRAVMLALRTSADPAVPIGPRWLEAAMIDLTALGGGTVLTIAVALTLGFLLLHRLWLTSALVICATVSGSIAVDAAKYVVARPRPALVEHLVQVSSMSFPSGHSANSAIVYLTLAALVVQVVRGRAQCAYVLITAALLVAAIGVSRVYLGVHWPSDVLAGWSFGLLWALAWWRLGAWIRMRRARAPLRRP